MKEKILKELNRTLDVEPVVGFMSITLSYSKELGRVVPTITDITEEKIPLERQEVIVNILHTLGKELAACYGPGTAYVGPRTRPPNPPGAGKPRGPWDPPEPGRQCG